MREFIDYLRTFQEIPNEIIENIKCLHMSSDKTIYGRNTYFVTNDDQVYGVGGYVTSINQNQLNSSNDSLITLIPELCDKRIEEFFEGFQCFFARSGQNHIYGWGRNEDHILLNEEDYIVDQRPRHFEPIDQINIIQISCGWSHCLALTKKGLLFGWGNNREGQLGFKKKFKIVPVPCEIDTNIEGNIEGETENQIHAIHAFGNRSFMFTVYAIIYELTENGWKLLYNIGQYIDNFRSNELNANELGVLTEKPDEIMEIHFFYNEMIQVYKFNCVYTFYSVEEKNVVKTKYENLFEYFLCEKQFTYKTIHLKNSQLFTQNFTSTFIYVDSLESQFVDTFEEIKLSKSRFCSFSAQNMKITSKLNSLRFLSDLPKNIESDVKYYYISSEDLNSLKFFVMRDNSVIGFGSNKSGKLGFSDENAFYNYTPIPELCDQNIEEFFEGQHNMFARNSKCHIFGWGANEVSQLGRGFKSGLDEILKPQKIDYFDDKHIIQISCGYYHCFALSSNGDVYGWGLNDLGQTGCDEETPIIMIPTKLDLETPCQYINCYGEQSFVVTVEGGLKFWGDIDINEEIISNINDLKVKKIISSKVAFILLTQDGYLFSLIYETQVFQKIEQEIFCDIYITPQAFAFQSDGKVYEIDLRFFKTTVKLKDTGYLNFYDYYLNKHNNIFKTIHITNDGFLMTKEITLNQNYKQGQNMLRQEYKNVFERRFEYIFENDCMLGEGGSGQVFKVKAKKDNSNYAIKRLKANDEFSSTLNEIKILSDMKKDFVVQYYSAWVEAKVIDRQIVNYVYIQMQLCSQSLREVIQSVNTINERRFELFRYFISFQLLRELTECVDYLHSLTPPIIHRDLKPENVLISDGSDGRFLKLCDFGISKHHLKVITQDNYSKDTVSKYNHTRGQGDSRYMAPEKNKTQEYNTKSDIYSLAVIATEIYGLTDLEYELSFPMDNQDELISYSNRFENKILENKFRKLLETLSICLFSEDFNQRPDCKQLLHKMSECSVDKIVVLKDKSLTKFRKELKKYENEFLRIFLQKKIGREGEKRKIYLNINDFSNNKIKKI